MNRGILWIVLAAIGTVLLHFFAGTPYGFHRDELATLDDARHLAWGFVAYPPITPFFGWLSLKIFGSSISGFRFFATVVDAGAIVLTALIARDFGGKNSAQLLAGLAALPFSFALGSVMQYVSFDYFFWVLLAFFVARRCATNDPRWWLRIGAAIGFGMLTKYTMLFFAAALVAGVLLTELRRDLRTRWLWLGAAISFVIFLPNLFWQLRHQFISLEFLNWIHTRDIRIGRTGMFLPEQLKLMFFAQAFALAGLGFYFFSERGRRFRVLGWMYVVTLILFVIAHGRSYYLAPAYPMLYAGGAVGLTEAAARWRVGWRYSLGGIATVLLLIGIIFSGAVFLPIAAVNSAWWKFDAKINGDLVEEIGWPELVETVAQIRDQIPPNELARLGILAGNYGEAAAINLYGAPYGLPTAISGINSFWFRGYGNPPPETLIVVGISRKTLERHFASCEVAGRITNRFGVLNEETSSHAEIFVCRGLREPWPEFWQEFRYFG